MQIEPLDEFFFSVLSFSDPTDPLPLLYTPFNITKLFTFSNFGTNSNLFNGYIGSDPCWVSGTLLNFILDSLFFFF